MMNKTALVLVYMVIFTILFIIPAWSQENDSFPWGPLLNIIPGFGIGSFIEGDIHTGTTSAIAELAGIILCYTKIPLLCYTGFFSYVTFKLNSIVSSLAFYNGYNTEYFNIFYVLPSFGIAPFIDSDIVGGIVQITSNALSTLLLGYGILKHENNYYIGGTLSFLISAFYGALRYYEYSYNLNFALPSILNLIPGFGLGSFIQGDYTVAAATLVSDLVGLAFLGAGSLFMGSMGVGFMPLGNFLGAPLLIIGGILYGGGKLFSIYKSINYGFRNPIQNKNNKKNLIKKQTYESRILPYMDISFYEDNNLGINMGITILQ